MASPATFVAYIDEAGDEGFKFGQGSSEWFVLGAVILRRASEMPEIKLIDDVRARLNRGRAADRQFPAKKALHFRDLQHDVCKYYANRIAQADLTSVVILIKKRDWIRDSHTSADRKKAGAMLYGGASVVLADAISSHCLSAYNSSEGGDGSVDLVFSSRSSLNYEDLSGFINFVVTNPENADHRGRATADIIRASQIRAVMHSKSMGLQIADAVTSSYFKAVEKSADGFTEDAYVRLLLPCAYRSGGELFGHGARFDYCSVETQEEMRREMLRWER